MALSFANPRTFDDDDRELLSGAGRPMRTGARACTAVRGRKSRPVRRPSKRSRARRAYSPRGRARRGAHARAGRAKSSWRKGSQASAQTPALYSCSSDDGTMLEVVNGQGLGSGADRGGWRRFSVDLKVPSTDALHRLEPVFIESEKDIRENYPHVQDYPHTLEGRAGLHARAGAHIPLVVSGRPLGVLFLGFTRPRRFSESQRSFVLALARQCAQALKRAQLYEAELEGRSRLSRLVERLHEGVVSVDRRGRVEFASSRAKQMLGAALARGGPTGARDLARLPAPQLRRQPLRRRRARGRGSGCRVRMASACSISRGSLRLAPRRRSSS